MCSRNFCVNGLDTVENTKSGIPVRCIGSACNSSAVNRQIHTAKDMGPFHTANWFDGVFPNIVTQTAQSRFRISSLRLSMPRDWFALRERLIRASFALPSGPFGNRYPEQDII